jgi:hypothetical protein
MALMSAIVRQKWLHIFTEKARCSYSNTWPHPRVLTVQPEHPLLIEYKIGETGGNCIASNFPPPPSSFKDHEICCEIRNTNILPSEGLNFFFCSILFSWDFFDYALQVRLSWITVSSKQVEFIPLILEHSKFVLFHGFKTGYTVVCNIAMGTDIKLSTGTFVASQKYYTTKSTVNIILIIIWMISGAVTFHVWFANSRTRVQLMDGCVDKITSFAIYISLHRISFVQSYAKTKILNRVTDHRIWCFVQVCPVNSTSEKSCISVCSSLHAEVYTDAAWNWSSRNRLVERL